MPAALEIKVPLNPPRSVLFFLGGRTGDPKQGGENCDADGEQNNHDHTFSMNRPPRAKRKMKPSATDYGLWACHAKAAIAFAAVNKYEARRDQPAGGNRRATRLNQPPVEGARRIVCRPATVLRLRPSYLRTSRCYFGLGNSAAVKNYSQKPPPRTALSSQRMVSARCCRPATEGETPKGFVPRAD